LRACRSCQGGQVATHLAPAMRAALLFPDRNDSKRARQNALYGRMLCTGHKHRRKGMCGVENEIARAKQTHQRSSFHMGARW
jgi:hypothetical protein